ncbi:glycosyltransferase family 2 protein [Vulgatibacter sp.]|uniref:glycosyltransferase family 2 protein n=1 Tax=Vulgatibacter sp. TaxID=1971226 RepID=UPI00356B3768
MVELIFWLCALGVLHTYLFYPLVLVALEAARGAVADLRYVAGGRDRRSPAEPLALPSVSVVVAAYNEADVIGEKVQNSLALDYPAEKIEVVIGSDGSDDGTDEIVAACEDRRIRLDSSRQRSGKVGVLNRTIPTATGDIVVLSDANTMLDRDSIRKLVRHFRDPRIGAVCGRLRLYNPKKSGYEESAYWVYESFLKLHEGKRGAVLGANGGLYAIRKKLFTPLPPNTIVDDFVIAMRCLQRGYQVIYDPEAVAIEETTEDYAKERIRRVRIAAGNFQSLGLVGDLLHPKHGFAAFAFFSHKLLRWLVPFLLAFAFLANLSLLHRPLYQATFAVQMLFYWLAVIGFAVRLPGPIGKLASIARYFVEMNVGMAQGFVRYVRRTQKVTWQRTARVS